MNRYSKNSKNEKTDQAKAAKLPVMQATQDEAGEQVEAKGTKPVQGTPERDEKPHDMKTLAEIDPTLRMSRGDFTALFAHLPLTEKEEARLEEEYFKIYETFLDNKTEPTDAWLATRNIFLIKEQQVGARATGKTIGIAGDAPDEK